MEYVLTTRRTLLYIALDLTMFILLLLLAEKITVSLHQRKGLKEPVPIADRHSDNMLIIGCRRQNNLVLYKMTC